MGGATECLRYATSMADSQHEMFGTQPMIMGRCGGLLKQNRALGFGGMPSMKQQWQKLDIHSGGNMMLEEDKLFVVKNNINVEGIDENFVWYESQILREAMNSWSYKFEKMVRVMEARHKEHLQMLATVMAENAALKRKLKEKDSA